MGHLFLPVGRGAEPLMKQCGRICDHYNFTIGDLCIFLRSEGFDGRSWPAGYENHQDQKVIPVRKGRALTQPYLPAGRQVG